MRNNVRKTVSALISILAVSVSAILISRIDSAGLFLLFTWIPAIFFSVDKNLVSAIKQNPGYVYILIIAACFVYGLIHILINQNEYVEVLSDTLSLLVDLFVLAGFIACRGAIYRLFGIAGDPNNKKHNTSS